MGRHDISTAERPIVEDTADNRRWFAQRLHLDLTEWLPDILASAPTGTIFVGHEGERPVFNRDLSPAFAAGPQILTELQQLDNMPGHVMGELVRSLIEVVSDQYSLEHDGFRRLRDDMTAWQYAIQAAAQRYRCFTAAFGTVPWDAEHFQGDTLVAMIDARRYEVYRQRMPGWMIRLLDGSEFGTTLGFKDVVGIGPLTAHQFSIDIPANRLHDFVNAANVAVSLLRAWFPNGDTPFNIEVEQHDMRIEAFDEATVVNRIHRTFIGPRWATSPHGVFEDLVGHVGGQSIFLDADENELGSALKQLLSSIFPLVRVRFGKRGDKITIYLEIRPLSGGPTTAHEVSATAAGVGLMYHIASDIDNWTRFGFHHIQSNFWNSGYGLDSELFWQRGGRDFTDTARNIADKMLGKIKQALIDDCHAQESDVEEALEPAITVLRTGMTPTRWGKMVRADLRDSGCSREQAMVSWLEYYLRSTGYGTSSAFVGDWTNPVPALVLTLSIRFPLAAIAPRGQPPGWGAHLVPQPAPPDLPPDFAHFSVTLNDQSRTRNLLASTNVNFVKLFL